MTTKASFAICLSLVFTGFLIAQTTETSVLVGFQAEDTEGNTNIYRSQVNQDGGPLLEAFHFSILRPKTRVFDRLRLDANGFGAQPHGRVRLQIDKQDWYRFKLSYSRADHFNALDQTYVVYTEEDLALRAPGFTSHTTNRVREWADISLEFLPSHKLRPVLGFAYRTYYGPGITTYHLGQNEYRLGSNLDERETEMRAGLRYVEDWIDAEVIQTWRDYNGKEDRYGFFLPSSGFNRDPVLGEELFLEDFSSRSDFDTDTSVTSATIRVTPSDEIRLLANYLDTDPESELRETEIFTGQFASFQINRFFTGGNQSIRTRTDNPSWRGDLRMEWDAASMVEVSAGFTRRELELDGNALLQTLYLDSVTFTGGNQRDYQELIDAQVHQERDEDILEIQLATTGLGNFRLWGAYQKADQDLFIDESLAQIVVPSGQEGAFERSIDKLRLGGQYKSGPHSLAIEYQVDDADQSVLRTDFLDRDTFSLRGKTSLFNQQLRLSGNAKWVDAENPANAIALQMDLFQAGFNADVSFSEQFELNLSYGIFDLENQIEYRDPLFNQATSFHREDGTDITADLRWTNKQLEILGGYGRYDNDGALQFTLDRAHLDVTWSFSEHFRAIFRADRYEYDETLNPISNYDADVFALLVGWQK